MRATVPALRANRAVGSCERPNNTLVPLRWNDGAVMTALTDAERIVRVTRAATGHDLRWTSGYLSLKDPRSGPLWWHQDWWCWDHPVSWWPTAPQVALICSLDDTSSTRGALRVLPGSHRTSTDLHAELPEGHRHGRDDLPHQEMRDDAGSAPMKHGVVETSTPPTIKLFSEMWWPPKRQPHGSSPPGTPKTRR